MSCVWTGGPACDCFWWPLTTLLRAAATHLTTVSSWAVSRIVGIFEYHIVLKDPFPITFMGMSATEGVSFPVCPSGPTRVTHCTLCFIWDNLPIPMNLQKCPFWVPQFGVNDSHICSCIHQTFYFNTVLEILILVINHSLLSKTQVFQYSQVLHTPPPPPFFCWYRETAVEQSFPLPFPSPSVCFSFSLSLNHKP